MKTSLPYHCKVRLKNRNFTVRLYPTEGDPDKFLMELETRGWLSGDEFAALRKYLEQEGYIDQAYDYYGNRN